MMNWIKIFIFRYNKKEKHLFNKMIVLLNKRKYENNNYNKKYDSSVTKKQYNIKKHF